MMTDPLADMLTRIRNGQLVRSIYVDAPLSNLKLAVLEVLKKEGYIKDFEKEENNIRIYLKYNIGKPAIRVIKRISKPGRKVYSKIDKLKKFMNGLGVVILSTPKGVMSDHEARVSNIGGEILCRVF